MSPRCASISKEAPFRCDMHLYNGRPVYEHNKQVDFRTGDKSAEYLIMTFFPAKQEDSLGKELFNLHILGDFDLITRSLANNKQIVVATFKPLLKSNRKARRDLLKYLAKCHYPIIWKEDNHGYHISSSGYVNRKWLLKRLIPHWMSPEEWDKS